MIRCRRFRLLSTAVLTLSLALLLLCLVDGFTVQTSWQQTSLPRDSALYSTSVGSSAVDPNVYNVDLETATDLWTASVSPTNSNMREAGIPFLDSKSKDYYVDDVEVVVSREGGMGMDLLELAGGREDGYGITIVTGVSGNAQKAGVLPGDSITAVTVTSSAVDEQNNVEEISRSAGCECLDFDGTIQVLSQFDSPQVQLSIKRLRRWPKLKVVVEYPTVQVAEGADNKEVLELVAGENLKRALQTRGIIFEDPLAGKCDFCGQACTVRVTKGMPLISPEGLTEKKIMAKNPGCRLSCKATVGHNLQEGEIQMQINLRQWDK